jgi:UDP-N-acetylmuramoyl-L-alanyl-D-glutamate--2,6-diaminopimelate ligase
MTKVVRLSQVLEGLPGAAGIEGSSTASGVTADSRQVAPGTVFVAVRGGTSDGHEFLAAAQQAGAVLLVGEEPASARKLAAPYLQVADSRSALARLAANFHGNPSRALKVVGVTGTSGKTTTTYLIESILEAAGHEVGVIGTVNFRHGGKIYPSTHTTPGAVELQALLARMRDDGCTAVVMEVSSHALKQKRTEGIAFDAMAFTNLTPEHLDFHPDMEDYYLAKALLFTEYPRESHAAGKATSAAINVDDPYGQRLLRELHSGVRAIPYGFGPGAEVSGAGLKVDLSGIEGEGIHSPLPGRFNASNVLAAVAVGHGLGLEREAIRRGIENLKSVPGRLERVPNPHGIHVLVDYAHKPDALEKVLRALFDVRGGKRLITVFGCGGDRDRTKRPVMGRLAAELSDRVYVTSDNPRTEDPDVIIREIVAGMAGYSNFAVEADRRQAIGAAIAEARKGDIVLIAGKGHEDYQILGTRKAHFDDREVAAEALTRVFKTL